VACPDQDLPRLVDRQPSRLDQLGFEILNIVVIKMELPLQGPIGDTPIALEQIEYVF
jgi:hypothetical protein